MRARSNVARLYVHPLQRRVRHDPGVHPGRIVASDTLVEGISNVTPEAMSRTGPFVRDRVLGQMSW
jgi:hypothetical protein